MVQMHLIKSRLVLVTAASALTLVGVVACKARTFNSGNQSDIQAAIINRPTDFHDDLPKGFDAFGWKEKVDYLWKRNIDSVRHEMYDPSPRNKKLIAGTPDDLPNFGKLRAFVMDTLDFRGRSVESIAGLTVFSRLRDVYPKEIVEENGKKSKHKRATHPTGTLGMVAFVPAQDTPYTGMFKTGATGLARLSSATNPYITDVMNRSLAIKFPVTSSYSRSLFAMHRVVGQKIAPGQEIKKAIRLDPQLREATDYRYFKAGKHLTNILPPPQGFEANITAKFADVAKYIVTATGYKEPGGQEIDFQDMASRLSVDNMAWHDQDGNVVTSPKAPKRIVLIPNTALFAKDAKTAKSDMEKMDFRDELARIEPNTVLWTVYGVDSKENPPVDIDSNPRLDVEKLGKPIGTIVLKEKFYASVFANEQIMFKHFVADIQQKEDLDRAFGVIGEARLEKPEDAIEDVLPTAFLAAPPTTAMACAPKTTFDDNPRKKAVFAPYLKEFDFIRSDLAPFCMARENKDDGFPEELQGVWWMNGNTAAETLVSFGQAEWDPRNKRVKLDPTSQYTWAWYASSATRDRESTHFSKKTTTELAGMKNYRMINNQTLEFTMNPGEKMKNVKIDGFVGRIMVPKSLFDMTFLAKREPKETAELLGVDAFEDDQTVGQDVIYRRTRILNGLISGDYRLTRILDKSGMPIAKNYQVYLDTMRKFNLVYVGIRNNVPAPEQKAWNFGAVKP